MNEVHAQCHLIRASVFIEKLLAANELRHEGISQIPGQSKLRLTIGAQMFSLRNAILGLSPAKYSGVNGRIILNA